MVSILPFYNIQPMFLGGNPIIRQEGIILMTLVGRGITKNDKLIYDWWRTLNASEESNKLDMSEIHPQLLQMSFLNHPGRANRPVTDELRDVGGKLYRHMHERYCARMNIDLNYADAVLEVGEYVRHIYNVSFGGGAILPLSVFDVIPEIDIVCRNQQYHTLSKDNLTVPGDTRWVDLPIEIGVTHPY